MKEFGVKLSSSGELVGAEGLAPPGEARIVRAAKSGAPALTDGPFAESNARCSASARAVRRRLGGRTSASDLR